MKRKLISLALTAILTVSSAATVMAAKKPVETTVTRTNVYGIGGYNTSDDIKSIYGSGASVSLSEKEQKSGAGCLKVDVSGGNSFGSAWIPAPLVAGETYEISFDYKTTGPDGTMTFIMQYADGGYETFYPVQTFTKDWQTVTYIIEHKAINQLGVQTSGSGHFNIRYGNGKTAVSYFIDNFRIVPYGNVEADYSSVQSKDGKKETEESNDFTSIVPERKTVSPVKFSDVENHWAKDTVNTLASYNYIDGMGDNTYAPNANVTRAQFVKMVVDTYHLDARKYNGEFSDVKGDEWFADYLSTASQLGLLESALTYGGVFHPDRAITREEAASIAAKAAKAKGAEKGDSVSFTDMGASEPWAQAAVKDAAEYGLILGYENGTYLPKNNITRAEAAQILYRIAEIETLFNIYVDSVTGSDKNDGSKSAPLKTVFAAQEMVDEHNDSMRNDITVHIRGKHYLDKTWEFDADDSGTNGYQVIYTSWGDEKAELSMGRKYRGFSLHDKEKNIYKTYVGIGTITRQAYFNEKKGIRSRSVAGFTNPEFVDGSYYYADDTYLLDYAYPEEIEMQYFIHWMHPIAGIGSVEPTDDGRVKITPDQTRWSKIQSQVVRYPGTPSEIPGYLMNAYEFLDAKGEWYMNIHDGFLYYIPRDGEDMSTMELLIPVGEDLIIANGANVEVPIHNITFDNLKFCDVGWTFPTQYDGMEYGQNLTLDWDNDGGLEDAPAGVTVTHGWYMDFTNNEFTRIGKNGLNILGGVKYSNVIGNEFYDLSGRGATFSGVGDGVRPLAANPLAVFEYNKFNNNYIHDVCTDYLGMGALTVGYPRYTEICHNEIANVPYSGIHIGWGWAANAGTGSDMYEIKMNNNFIQETNNDRIYDGGSIYSLGSQSLDAVDNKSEWSYNYFVNNRNAYSSVYPDEGSTSWEVSHNVIDNRDVPIMEFNWDHETIEYKDWYWLMNHVPTIKYNDFHDNYSTQGRVRHNAPDNNYGSVYEYPNAEWPAEAQEIIKNAGIEDAYKGNFDFEGPKYFVTNRRTYEVLEGEPKKLEIKVTGRYLKEYNLEDFDINYYVSQPNVLEIAKDGTMTAVGTGLVDVMITAEVGGVTQIKQVKVYAGESVEQVLPSVAQMNLIGGNSTKLGVIGVSTYGRQEDITDRSTIQYTSADATIATVDENGMVSAIGDGATSIHMVVTFEDKTYEMDVPVKIIRYSKPDSLDLPYEMAPAAIFSAGSWTAGAVSNEDGTGVIVSGSPSYVDAVKITNKLIAFDMKIIEPGDWPSLTFGAKDRMNTYQTGDTYLIGFKPTFIEMQRFNKGVRTMVFGEESFNPVGGPGVPNENGEIYQAGKTYSVITGILDTPEGTRVVLTVNGVNIFDYTDTAPNAVSADGYFGIYESNGKFEFTPYTGRTN